MPKNKTKKPKGVYQFAIEVLRENASIIMSDPKSWRKPKKRIASLQAAIDVLETNNLPPPQITTVGEIFDEFEAEADRKAAAPPILVA